MVNKNKFQNHILLYFIAGLLVIIPLLLVIQLFEWAIEYVNFVVLPYLPIDEMAFQDNPELISLMGISLAIVVVFGAGYVVSRVFGDWVLHKSEEIIKQIPFVKNVYMSSKKIFFKVLHEDEVGINRVVLVQYPTKDCWSVGFVTTKTQGVIGKTLSAKSSGAKFLNVFIPTTPNPTSGNTIIVKEKNVVDLNLSFDEAVNFVSNAGVGSTKMKKIKRRK